MPRLQTPRSTTMTAVSAREEMLRVVETGAADADDGDGATEGTRESGWRVAAASSRAHWSTFHPSSSMKSTTSSRLPPRRSRCKRMPLTEVSLKSAARAASPRGPVSRRTPKLASRARAMPMPALLSLGAVATRSSASACAKEGRTCSVGTRGGGATTSAGRIDGGGTVTTHCRPLQLRVGTAPAERSMGTDSAASAAAVVGAGARAAADADAAAGGAGGEGTRCPAVASSCWASPPPSAAKRTCSAERDASKCFCRGGSGCGAGVEGVGAPTERQAAASLAPARHCSVVLEASSSARSAAPAALVPAMPLRLSV